MPFVPRENMIAFADKHLQPYRIHGDELQTEFCPICNGGDHSDKWTFSLNLEECAGNCRRGSCGWKGSFSQLARHFGEQVAAERSSFAAAKVAKHYDLPDVTKYSPPTEQIYDYFKSRSISKATVDAFHLLSDANGNIVFPFYRDGALIYVKYREPVLEKSQRKRPSKEWSQKNTCPILFGMDMVEPKKPICVTEGMIDCMSLYEAGIRNVLSVPSGCDNMEWVEQCWDWLEKFDEIILFGDNDDPGRKMVQTLLKRLGEYRCRTVDEYPVNTAKGTECKDANEILVRCGDLALCDMVDNAKAVPVKGLIDLADVVPVDPTTIERIKTGIPRLDEAIGGLRMGSVTVLTGKPGEGKSTLVGLFALQAIEQGYNVCAYSGELPKEEFQQWIDLQAAGSKYITLKFDKVRGKGVPVLQRDAQDAIHSWYRGHFFLTDSSEVYEKSEGDSVLELFQIAARRYGCSVFFVDNMLTLTGDSEEETRAQGRFINALKRFAIRFSCHVVVVAHARKLGKDTARLGMDDISGNSAVVKLAHSALVIEKPDIRIIKARDSGLLGNISCCYEGASRRIWQSDAGDLNSFGWDKTNVSEPKVLAISAPEYGIMMKQEEPF